jgi:DNA-binding NarL/FixJ family response regulator
VEIDGRHLFSSREGRGISPGALGGQRQAHLREQVGAGCTRREADVVRLVAQGLNNRQVAREMFVSEATVKTHLNHILAKLSRQDRATLIAWAWRNGLAGSAGISS